MPSLKTKLVFIANFRILNRTFNLGTLLILSLVLLFSACKKDKTTPETELSKLPAATQSGANTFGCLVNGKAFKPNGSIFSGPRLQCYYTYIENTYQFYVSGSQNADTKNLPLVGVGTTGIEIKQGETYQMKTSGTGNPYGLYYFGNDTYETQSEGELTITKLDMINHIVSGTFWFDATNTNGDKVEIREGRFDVPFTQ